MDVPILDPANLTGFGAFMTLAFWNVWAHMSGRTYSRAAVKDMRAQYEARILQENSIGTMWRIAYEKEVAAKDLRWSAVGNMMLEQSKTVAHALESIQEEGRREGVGHVPPPQNPNPTTG